MPEDDDSSDEMCREINKQLDKKTHSSKLANSGAKLLPKRLSSGFPEKIPEVEEGKHLVQIAGHLPSSGAERREASKPDIKRSE